MKSLLFMGVIRKYLFPLKDKHHKSCLTMIHMNYELGHKALQLLDNHQYYVSYHDSKCRLIFLGKKCWKKRCLFFPAVVALQSQNNKSISRWPNRGEQTNGLGSERRSRLSSHFAAVILSSPVFKWLECRCRGEMIDTILYLINNSASLQCCPGCHSAD